MKTEPPPPTWGKRTKPWQTTTPKITSTQSP
jgi:hypothetical protein